ncbi:lipase 3-like isoform X2 [Belonocnema kinseyi]|uniref:lipase 3-like isoform X2 n=1 Tax=Belonocnema kinseyi TaxID=2817044 RepID=UPI00143E0DD2|nr:lipase 3-like isoform X2 [Belonocnema kinseyi]
MDAFRHPHEDSYLSVVELIDKYGYNPETHVVATYDKYILEMHRITGPKNNSNPKGKPTVFLMHGLLLSSNDWIIAGPRKAFGYILAEAGYDVWMGNARGTFYSRKHLNSSISKKSYWSFSWHEIGTRDLPAMIDYILEKTGHKKIFYVGHSQGSTSFFVMASELPKYNEKIISMNALAPIAFCKNLKSPLARILDLASNEIEVLTKLIGIYEFPPTNLFLVKIISKVCDETSFIQPLCVNLLFILCGFSPSQMNLTWLPIELAHLPAGASLKQFAHYAQLIKSNKFRKFDYGLTGNLKKYGKLFPPDYNLSKITTRVALHYSDNDYFAATSDVARLYRQLRNPIGKIRVPDHTFNHVDFMWGIDANTLIYEKIMRIMSRYQSEAIN